VCVEHHRTFVMLDPTTDQVLAQCNGPAASGACPVADRPPYTCAGLHLLGIGQGPVEDGSFTVTRMEPGRCPLVFIDEPREEPPNG
jgi:hypothetical protein